MTGIVGKRTDIIALGSLAGMGGLAAGGGLQLIMQYAPVIVTVLLPVFAYTLRAAIRNNATIAKAAVTAEDIAEALKGANLGTISMIADQADRILDEAMKPEPVAK